MILIIKWWLWLIDSQTKSPPVLQQARAALPPRGGGRSQAGPVSPCSRPSQASPRGVGQGWPQGSGGMDARVLLLLAWWPGSPRLHAGCMGQAGGRRGAAVGPRQSCSQHQRELAVPQAELQMCGGHWWPWAHPGVVPALSLLTWVGATSYCWSVVRGLPLCNQNCFKNQLTVTGYPCPEVVHESFGNDSKWPDLEKTCSSDHGALAA